MRHHLEAVLVEQGVVLSAVEARVVQGFPRKGPDCLAMQWTAREHQRSARSGVLAENRKHPALIFGTQMEEAVPGENTVERYGPEPIPACLRRASPDAGNGARTWRSSPVRSPRRSPRNPA